MSRLLPWLRPCRWTPIAIALLVLLVPVLAPMPGATQEEPDLRPTTTTFFYDENGLFDGDQRAALERDAQLLQSTGIPIVVYVRVVTADQAAKGESRAFADAIRREWKVESAPGADDGLVLLFSWVPQQPLASSTVQSFSEHTFDGSALSPDIIAETISTSVSSLVEQGHPFDALIYLMRETRYTGIYAPPPPAPLEGTAKTLHGVLAWAAPVAAIGAGIVLLARTVAFWRRRPAQRDIVAIVAAIIGGSTALWALAVYAQSRIGVVSALAMLVELAVAAWAWSRVGFRRHGGRTVRRRAVPSTLTLMRKRHQARAMVARETGGRP